MKRARRQTAVIFVLAFLSGAGLLHVSQMVQSAEDRLERVRQQVAQEREAIRVLKAEWAYLNSPARLEVLSQEYLGLSAPKAESLKIGGGARLPEAAPMPMLEEIPPQDLFQEIAVTPPSPPSPPEIEEPAISSSPAAVPPLTPGRKPQALKENFSDLIDRLSDEGGAP